MEVNWIKQNNNLAHRTWSWCGKKIAPKGQIVITVSVIEMLPNKYEIRWNGNKHIMGYNCDAALNTAWSLIEKALDPLSGYEEFKDNPNIKKYCEELFTDTFEVECVDNLGIEEHFDRGVSYLIASNELFDASKLHHHLNVEDKFGVSMRVLADKFIAITSLKQREVA